MELLERQAAKASPPATPADATLGSAVGDPSAQALEQAESPDPDTVIAALATLDVLTLLADGPSNPEIAERLVVSARTGDHHVSAILAKLGVTSGREAARFVR